MFRVLAIGNSFSQDAMQYLAQLAAGGGVEMEAVNLYIGGCSLKTHWENMQSGAAAYEQERNGKSEGQMTSLEQALEEGGWDAVTLQQASHDSGLPERYFPYICLLAGEVRTRAPQARLWVHQTWAYELDSGHPAFAQYGHNQSAMFQALEAAYRRRLIPLARLLSLRVQSSSACGACRPSIMPMEAAACAATASIWIGYTGGMRWRPHGMNA